MGLCGSQDRERWSRRGLRSKIAESAVTSFRYSQDKQTLLGSLWWDWGVAEQKMGFCCLSWLSTKPAVSFCLTNWAIIPVPWGPARAAPIRGPWWYQRHHRVCCLAHKPCGQRRCVWCGLGLWMSAASALILTTASGMSWCVGPKHVSSYSVWHARVKQIWEPWVCDQLFCSSTKCLLNFEKWDDMKRQTTEAIAKPKQFSNL